MASMKTFHIKNADAPKKIRLGMFFCGCTVMPSFWVCKAFGTNKYNYAILQDRNLNEGFFGETERLKSQKQLFPGISHELLGEGVTKT